MKYFVMEQSDSAAGGANSIAVKTRKADAESMCKGWDNRWVLTEREYDKWHEENINSYYNEQD